MLLSSTAICLKSILEGWFNIFYLYCTTFNFKSHEFELHTLWTTPWIFLNIATLLINQFSTKPRPLILLWCVCPVLAWPRAWRCIAWTRLILPWAAAAEVPPLDELRVVNHPEAAEVVLVAHEAFVQRQVRANGILQVRAAAGRKRKGKRRKDY